MHTVRLPDHIWESLTRYAETQSRSATNALVMFLETALPATYVDTNGCSVLAPKTPTASNTSPSCDELEATLLAMGYDDAVGEAKRRLTLPKPAVPRSAVSDEEIYRKFDLPPPRQTR